MTVRISKNFGVNPSVDTCFICGEEISVVLFGTAYKDKNGKTAEAPKNVCTGNICDNCKQIIENGGIFFIAVKDGESGNNPYRTGKISALKEEAVKRIFPDFPYKKINYIEDTVYNQIFNNK